MFEELETRWKGVINKSSLMIAKEVLYYKQQEETLAKRVSYMLLATVVSICLFVMINGVNILAWIDNTLDTFFLTGVIIVILVFLHFKKELLKAQLNFKKFRDMLIKRIDADFCNCGRPCDHKEQFMDYMQNKYGVNLYY